MAGKAIIRAEPIMVLPFFCHVLVFNKFKWENSTVRKKEQEMLVNVETHQPNAATGYWEPYGKR